MILLSINLNGESKGDFQVKSHPTQIIINNA